VSLGCAERRPPVGGLQPGTMGPGGKWDSERRVLAHTEMSMTASQYGSDRLAVPETTNRDLQNRESSVACRCPFSGAHREAESPCSTPF